MRSAIFARIIGKLALIACASATLCFYSSADTIVSVTDSATPVNRATYFLGGQFSNVVAASWTQATSFSNVTIDASLVSDNASFRSGTAYLMNAIGPGTTPVSEIVAPVNFTAPLGDSSGPVPLTVLFSGLNLGPGPYFLVLTAPFSNETQGSDLRWQIPTDSVTTTAASVTIGNGFEANTSLFPANPFVPASTFVLAAPPMFDVTTPEPSSLLLLCAGFLGLAGVGLRRKRLA